MNITLPLQWVSIENYDKSAKSKLFSELESQIKKQESTHELSIKKLKSEIKLLKVQFESNVSNHKNHLDDLQTKYTLQIKSEQGKALETITTLEENLRNSQDNLKEIRSDLHNIDKIGSRIRNSCTEELENLEIRKKQLKKVQEGLSESIKTIQLEKIGKLKEELKLLKKSQKSEKTQIFEDFEKIRKGLGEESSYKTELMRALEFSLSDLKSELMEITSCNKEKVFKLGQLMNKAATDADHYDFSLQKLKSSQKSLESPTKSLESRTHTLCQELDHLKLLNSNLKDRSAKLFKFIYGKSHIPE